MIGGRVNRLSVGELGCVRGGLKGRVGRKERRRKSVSQFILYPCPQFRPESEEGREI